MCWFVVLLLQGLVTSTRFGNNMGKTKTPLKINVTDPGMLKWPEVEELIEGGHQVAVTPTDADLVLGPQCHAMEEALRRYLPLAVKRAQERVKAGRKAGGE